MKPIKLAVLGDSLTAGYGLPAPAAFPVRLQKALADKGIAADVHNAGVSGDTTTGGLARLDWSIPPGTEAVIVELGANDALRGVDPQVARGALDDILNKLKARNIAVLLCGMYAPPNYGAEYTAKFNSIYPDLAKAHMVPLYPFFLDGVATEAKLTQPDGLHPTAAGVDVVVERILPTVEGVSEGSCVAIKQALRGIWARVTRWPLRTVIVLRLKRTRVIRDPLWCPESEVRLVLRRAPQRTSDSKGHQKIRIPVWFRFASPQMSVLGKCCGLANHHTGIEEFRDASLVYRAGNPPRTLATRSRVLRGGLPGARWIDPENYHVTLRFIGDIDGVAANEIASTLERINRKPFEVALQGLSSFGGKKAPGRGGICCTKPSPDGSCRRNLSG